MLTLPHRTSDDQRLREKVDEALAVFNDYVKTQGNDGSRPPEASTVDEPAAEGETEAGKA